MKILSLRDYSSKLRLTVQASGKLCFTDETVRTLGIKDGMPIRFAIEEKDGDQLYMAIASEGDEDTFSVRKSGKSYYLPTSGLFDALGIDYRANSVSFNLTRAGASDEVLKGAAYVMKISTNKRKEGKTAGHE